MRLGAGIAPAETKHASPIAAIPSNETYLMMDTCAGGSIFPRGFDLSVMDDPTVAPVQLATATDVSFPIVSTGEASQQGNWFVFGPGCQAMLPGSCGEHLRSCV